ncbi:hypothetical protein N7495_000812 [Penicillium taxi]|uniref:uncharacterized protein n=1 Tax=Penicillium taxi TaxID=168475 RepID=UPI0025456C9E|nr:uncharacterized protein N7495_000812 [Penicillium taxi]KAJ5908130.1 hypothetical protein N7495_000812 [Penicillium taxi]
MLHRVPGSLLISMETGQPTMTAIFGKTANEDLFSVKNVSWLNHSPRAYKLKILDHNWEKLDLMIHPCDPLTWRELDGRTFMFKTDHRPAARYLYYHYCVQILRHAWQHTMDGRSTIASQVLRDETAGSYLPKSMLLAFVQELRHEYEDLLEGASRERTDPIRIRSYRWKNLK